MLLILNTMKNKESRLKGYSKNFCCCVANSCAISRALAVNIVNIYLFKVFFFSTCNFLKGKNTLSDRREKFYNDLWDSG